MKNKKTKVAIISVIALILVTIAVTYAYWLVTKTQTGENEITAGCLDIAISGEKNDIELTNQFPMSDEEGMKLVPYEFTVTNNCNTSVDYQVALEATGTESNAITTSALKVALNDSVSLLSNNAEVDPTIDGAYESRLIGFSRLAASGNEGSSDTYTLRLWIDEDAPISEMNKTFKSKISVTIGQGIESPYEEGTLAYSILANVGGSNSATEIDGNGYEHRIITEGEKDYSSAVNYYGTDYTFDEETKKYTLSGDLVYASKAECGNGTKTCGKYTLKSSNSTDSSATLYEVTEFAANHIVSTAIKYTTQFGLKTEADESGIYKTQDDLGDSYYFRGNPTNNYVEFGNFNYSKFVNNYGNIYDSMDTCESAKPTSCDVYDFGIFDNMMYNTYETEAECESAIAAYTCNEYKNPSMYWRIVRINGDGTIRLIYDGNAKLNIASNINTTPYASADNAKYVGYTYDTSDTDTTQVDSMIKGVVDEWYEEYLKTTYGNYIADSIFCNDRTEFSKKYYDENYALITDSGAATYTDIDYGAHDRLVTNKTPNLKCTNKSDRYTVDDITNGNGLLSNPVGLITADEVVFAGGNASNKNINFYLYTSAKYWTLTPSFYNETAFANAYAFYIDNDGYLSNQNITVSNTYARPVISLRANVEFTGNGTIDNPYKIVTE